MARGGWLTSHDFGGFCIHASSGFGNFVGMIYMTLNSCDD